VTNRVLAVLNTQFILIIIGVFNMSRDSSGRSYSLLWRGKPWILPSVLARTILIIVIAAVVFWLEFYLNLAYVTIANVQIMLWTGLVFFLVWIISLSNLLLLRASSIYILRNDSLEIKTGITTSKSYVVVPSGFSDLEVIRSISARIMNSGDIIIRAQSETDSERRMVRVRNALKVADQIREVMARPIVRIEGPEPTEEKKP
jgi:hypothetical protein